MTIYPESVYLAASIIKHGPRVTEDVAQALFVSWLLSVPPGKRGDRAEGLKRLALEVAARLDADEGAKAA